MNSLFGMRILESPLLPDVVPVLSVRDSCPMTEEGRARMNAYLLETFGVTRVFYVQGGQIFTSPNNAAHLRAACSHWLR